MMLILESFSNSILVGGLPEGITFVSHAWQLGAVTNPLDVFSRQIQKIQMSLYYPN